MIEQTFSSESIMLVYLVRGTIVPYSLVSSCKVVIITLLCVFNWSCSNLPQEIKQTRIINESNSVPALGNIEYHTSLLADELFANVNLDRDFRYAVVTFVPVDNLKYDQQQQNPLMLLGHQLSEGMITEATRRGFITQDYKATNDIVVTKQADYVFSRDVTQLQPMKDIDFYIAGTITEQQEGAIVNARIIHVQTKDIVASATKFFPADVFWQREKVTSRNGMIYRTGS